MVDEILKKLLEAGVHFGHQRKRWNPKMAQYIFGEKNGIYIIDLEKTVAKLKEACDFLKDITSRGGYVIFVGTKKQAQGIIKSAAQRCEMFYVDQRWLGGMLTNFSTIKKSIARFNEIKKMKDDGIFDKITKKEVSQLMKESNKLENSLGGVIEMERLPQALFVIDVKKEDIAVKEANTLSIPIAAIIDTNSDPTRIKYPIPANDDAIRSIEIITSIVADAVLEGRNAFKSASAKKLEEKEEKLRLAAETSGAEVENLMVSESEEKKLVRKTKEEQLRLKKRLKEK